MGGRTNSMVGELARLGFSDVTRSATRVAELESTLASEAPGWLEVVASVPGPDLALQQLSAINYDDPGMVQAIFADEIWAHRLVSVLGASQGLGLHLRAHPGDAEVIRGDLNAFDRAGIWARMAERIGADLEQDSPMGIIKDPAAADLLRLANRRELLRIAARDLTHPEPIKILDEICAELSDLADAVLQFALAIARAQTPGHDKVRLGILAMGKCGAQEINYLSDVDVVHVAEPVEGVGVEEAMQIGARLAGALARICSAHSAAGTIWQVDAALRPEGKAGPLVRTLESHRVYYEKFAKNWEFQAMLKTRPAAGDLELGQQFCEMIDPMVWQVGGAPNFMADTQAMRKRVVSLIPATEKKREIKLGAGGLRDVEFSVQMLQLVHGRVDASVRTRGTLESLHALMVGGYIGRADGKRLDEAYRFLRVLEHREQLARLRRTHLMPDNDVDQRRLARQIGCADAEELMTAWRSTTREVLALQQRIFYSPLLEAVSRLSGEELRMSPQAATDRLHAMGFADPAAALRHMEALTTGLSRTAQIQRQLMPAMLRWFSEGPNPDLGLLTFRRLSEAMGATSWYMRALRDEDWMAERLAKIASSSRYVSEILRKDPSVVQLLASEESTTPRGRQELAESMAKVIDRHGSDHEAAVHAIRSLRTRELFRLAAGDILEVTDLATLGQGLSDLASASVDAILEVAARAVEGPRTRIGVVAMGRWGGNELGYASDADVMYVVDDQAGPGQIAWATQVITRAKSWLGTPGVARLVMDAGLRPDGKSGPLVRSLGSFCSYYEKWADTWEFQALLRAGHGAGDRDLTEALLEAIEAVRYPPEGIDDKQVAEIRRLKARMETERTKGKAAGNLKLGLGGLSDVEWTAQLIQLRHAGAHPGLRTTRTVPVLITARDLGLINASDADALIEAWTTASKLRNKTMLVRGRSSDQLPVDPREIASVSLLLGYEPGHASELLQDWAKQARYANQVVDRLFWGAQG